MTDYPAPNNHVFYNLLARCFVITQIDPEVAIRVPSLLASLLASYYFFKLLNRYLPSWLSLGLLTLLITDFYFAYYGFSARGYMLVYLFCILLLYVCGPLAQNYGGRYRALFVAVQVLGLFTVLSFLYVMVVPGIVLLAYVIRQRSWAALLKFCCDYAMVAVLTVACYSGILFWGDPSVLLNPEAWTDKFNADDPQWFDNLLFYLDTKFYEIFGFYKMKTAALTAFIVLLYYIWKREAYRLLVVIVCTGMFFSPFAIVLLHKVYPFGRSLFYLKVPSLMLLGFGVKGIGELLQNITRFQRRGRTSTLFQVLCVLACVVVFVVYPSRHRSGWDYHLNELRKKQLKEKIRNVDAIGKTGIGYEYYPADIILHYAHKEHPDVSISYTALDSVSHQDILLIHHSELNRLRPQLKGYSYLFDFQEIRLFLSDSIAEIRR